jgi:hypothetical protein
MMNAISNTASKPTNTGSLSLLAGSTTSTQATPARRSVVDENEVDDVEDLLTCGIAPNVLNIQAVEKRERCGRQPAPFGLPLMRN